MEHARTFAVILGLFTLSSAVLAQPDRSTNQPPGLIERDGPNGRAYKAGEVLVKFRADVTDQQIADAFRVARLGGWKQIVTPAMRVFGDDVGILRAATATPARVAARLLSGSVGVEYAQVNWIYTHQTQTGDSYFDSGALWGMMATGFGSAAETGWSDAGLAGYWGSDKTVYVGVIDEGIQYDHPDLAGNMWLNPGEAAFDNMDNDHNGYIDDRYGWNAIDGNGSIYDASLDDHGTHVSGTIGALKANGGVVGVNPHVGLISGKFLGYNGGLTTDAIEAIDYMTYIKRTKGVNIVALNNSWGGGGLDPALLDSIVRAAKQDILFVAAAGNGDSLHRAMDNDSYPVYPACYDTSSGVGYDSVISVTAIDSSGNRASFANYGFTTVDLGAPGVDIWSTVPGGTWATYNGTSMATPHVTGAIALYAAKYPGARASAIKEALLQSARLTPTPSVTGGTVTGGRLNVPAFLSVVPDGWTAPSEGAPAAPAFLTPTVSGPKVTLEWVDNSNNETGFELTRTPGETIALPAGVTMYVDLGCTPETPYIYSLKAKNGAMASVPIDCSVTTGKDSPYATAVALPLDTTTRGTWIGKYGSEGYQLYGYGLYSWLTSAQISRSGGLDNYWQAPSTRLRDTRALQTPTGGARFAACYFSGGFFTLDLNFSDTAVHQVSLYCLDWDRQSRNQVIEVLDFNHGTILDSQSLATFGDGKYVRWNISGHVVFRFIDVPDINNNAVVSGIFFDPGPAGPPPTTPPAAPTGVDPQADSKNQITVWWKDVSDNEQGFCVERSSNQANDFKEIARVGAGSTFYSNSGLARGTTYYYRVRAYNAAGYSDYSDVDWATTPNR